MENDNSNTIAVKCLYIAIFIAIVSLVMVLLYFVLWGPATRPWDYEMGPTRPLADYWLKSRLDLYRFYAPPIAIMIGISGSVLLTSLARCKKLPPDIGIISFFIPALAAFLVVYNPPLAFMFSCIGFFFAFGLAVFSLSYKWRWSILLSIPFNVLWIWQLFTYFDAWLNLVGD